MIIVYGTVIKMHVKIQQVGQWGMLLEHDHEESYEREGQNQREEKRGQSSNCQHYFKSLIMEVKEVSNWELRKTCL